MSSGIKSIENGDSNDSGKDGRRYGIVQIIQSLSEACDKNKIIVGLVVLVLSGILNSNNIVAFFNALKGFSVTLGFGK